MNQTTKPTPSSILAALPNALATINTEIAYRNLAVGGFRIAEHADGSGRWHVLADCCTTDLDDVQLRVLVNPATGSVGAIEDVTHLS